MKKTHFFLGVAALVFAFASAFAFKSVPLDENPSYLDSGGTCQQVENITCGGGTQDCVRQIEDVGNQTIRKFENATSCEVILQME